MERIIFDCDPGHDDAVALAMCKGLEDKIKVEMVIASHGNQTQDKTEKNALNLVQALELNAPVYSGSVKPLIRNPIKAGYIHGENGLEGPVFPPCRIKSRGNGIEAALELVRNNPGEITFVSTGPFTDLAVCIKADPDFSHNLKRIVVMGGSVSGAGNVTETAEFNVYADPEAAQIVFNCGKEVYMFGLDVTLQLLLNDSIVSKVQTMNKSNYSKIFLASMNAYTAACLKYIHDYPAMHDPCTIAWLAEPGIFEFEKRNITVDCRSELCYGKTVGSWPSDDGKVFVGIKANKEKFWSLFFKAIEKLP